MAAATSAAAAAAADAPCDERLPPDGREPTNSVVESRSSFAVGFTTPPGVWPSCRSSTRATVSVRGVRRFAGGAYTHSMIMRSKSGTVRYVEAHHNFHRKTGFDLVDR